MSQADGPSKFYHMEPISPEALKAIRTIISIAVDKEMIEEIDAERALKIMTINPHNRLTVLGRRLARLIDYFDDLKSLDNRTDVIVEQVKEEFEGLKTIIEWNPNWRDEKD
jgi:hypothetical protein|tara:strand:+ start:3218 stop:3550 length:333 start_codon:yes stop_codon:yes gene_type:complete